MSTVLVTGGSRGIGRAIVEEFCAAGHAVAFTFASDRTAADALVARLSEDGGRVLAHQADVRDFAGAQRVVAAVAASLGPVGVLVNNAGIRRDSALQNMDPALWHEVIDTNLTGTFNYARAVVKAMVANGGVILNVTSVSGVTGMAGQTNYSASKAGVIGFTKALSKEVAPLGIRVNAIAPGFIDTDMTGTMDEAKRTRMYLQIPARRPGTAAEVARMALYLAGADAAYVTGQVFTIDGGLT